MTAAAIPSISAAADTLAGGGIKLGIASYSFREFARGLCIKYTKQVGTPYLTIKEFRLVREICELVGIPEGSKGRRCDSQAPRFHWSTGTLNMLRPSFERRANWTDISEVVPPSARGRRIPVPAGSRGLGGPKEARTRRTGPDQREAVRAGHFRASRSCDERVLRNGPQPSRACGADAAK